MARPEVQLEQRSQFQRQQRYAKQQQRQQQQSCAGGRDFTMFIEHAFT